MSTFIQPHPTLYVKNIDWKVKKDQLRRSLYLLFTRFGKVLEIVALRKDGLRGQAFIIYEDVLAAQAALQSLNGFTFFGKDLVIEYARDKSDRIARYDGTFVPKAKRRKLTQVQGSDDHAPVNEQADVEPNDTTMDASALAPTDPQMQNAPAAPASHAPPPPSRYLLAQDLPAECNELMLGILFRPHAGFQAVRVPRPGLAFVEFESEPHATIAMQALQGFQLTPTESLVLQYGKE
jgi:U2 small nuclear ribonucleoprotein B''